MLTRVLLRPAVIKSCHRLVEPHLESEERFVDAFPVHRAGLFPVYQLSFRGYFQVLSTERIFGFASNRLASTPSATLLFATRREDISVHDVRHRIFDSRFVQTRKVDVSGERLLVSRAWRSSLITFLDAFPRRE